MKKYLVRNYGQLNASLELIQKMFILLKHSKENLPSSTFIEQMGACWTLLDFVGESLDASIDELSTNNHDDLVYSYEKLGKEIADYLKEVNLYDKVLA